MPVVTSLRNDNLKYDHWREIKDLIGQGFDIDSYGNFTLESLIKLNAPVILRRGKYKAFQQKQLQRLL
jgi:hypothetical protein